MSELPKLTERHELESLTTEEVYRELIRACIKLAEVSRQVKANDLSPEVRQELEAAGEQFHSEILRYAREYEQRPLEGGV